MLFINYRTPDGSGTARLLKNELSRHFGAKHVFLDSVSISPGLDFEKEILRRIRRAKILLAIIGQQWLTSADCHSGRAIDRADDWVRREIAEAIRCGVRVIPVLTGQVARLREADLPEDIAPLARYQYLSLRHESYNYDLARIVDQISMLVPRVSPVATDSQSSAIHVEARARGNGRIYISARDQVINE